MRPELQQVGYTVPLCHVNTSRSSRRKYRPCVLCEDDHAEEQATSCSWCVKVASVQRMRRKKDDAWCNQQAHLEQCLLSIPHLQPVVIAPLSSTYCWVSRANRAPAASSLNAEVHGQASWSAAMTCTLLIAAPMTNIRTARWHASIFCQNPGDTRPLGVISYWGQVSAAYGPVGRTAATKCYS